LLYSLLAGVGVAKQCSVTVNALEPHSIGARFEPLACPSLMVPSGGKTDVKLAISLLVAYWIVSVTDNIFRDDKLTVSCAV
jgi:hypothetical protein